jgi:hypothetical protein
VQRKTEVRKWMKWITLAGTAFAVVSGAAGQSFNLDINSPFGPPFAGGGPPSAAFSGPASQPGHWNAVNAAGAGTFQLSDLSGQLTNVILLRPVGGSGGNFNNPVNTGDYALLLNDGRGVNPEDSYTFTGLANGLYRLYTVAVAPNNEIVAAHVTVNGVTHTSTGPMPGNQFVLGITHVVHEAMVTNGTLAVTITSGGPTNCWLNGFQLQAVPEPVSLISLSIGVLSLITRKRRAAGRD